MRLIYPTIQKSLLTVTALTLFSLTANAETNGEKLVEEARCYACHQINDTLLGPSYLAISARHGARKEIMIDVLANKIVKGGGGNWGLVPMVPNQWVSNEEAKIMAEWILGLSEQQ